MKIGVIFDLDGTLADTLQDLHKCTNYILRQYGCPERTLAEIRSFVGNGARVQMTKALPGLPEDPPVDEVLAAYQDYYNTYCQSHSPELYPGILQALGDIGRKFPIAVVSNKPDPAVQAICQSCFGSIYARGVTGDCSRKPAPDMVFATMKALGVDACVYVGDSEVDVETASNAGMPCLSVLWGFRDRATVEKAGGKYFCQKAEDMLPMIHTIIEENF